MHVLTNRGEIEDIASTVMDHLENIRNDTARHRGERMVLGLGAFTEGQASMTAKEGNAISTKDILSQGSLSTVRRAFKGITITKTDPDALRNTLMREDSSRPDSGPPDDTISEKLPTENGSNQALDAFGPASNDQTHAQKSALGSIGTNTNSASKRQKTAKISTDADIEGSQDTREAGKDSSSPLELRRTFARAANILRQATGSDGVMFFDAQSANVGNDYRFSSAVGHSGGDDGRTSSEESLTSSGGSSEDFEENGNDYFSRPSPEREIKSKRSKRKCERLGHSFRLSSVVATTNGATSGMVLKESEMRRFIRRYPKGLVMHFTEDGEVSSSDESSTRDRVDTANRQPGMTLNQKEKKRVIAKELIKYGPPPPTPPQTIDIHHFTFALYLDATLLLSDTHLSQSFI